MKSPAKPMKVEKGHLERQLRAHLVFTQRATGGLRISYVRFRHLSYCATQLEEIDLSQPLKRDRALARTAVIESGTERKSESQPEFNPFLDL
jgi:hypothetical protein